MILITMYGYGRDVSHDNSCVVTYLLIYLGFILVSEHEVFTNKMNDESLDKDSEHVIIMIGVWYENVFL